MGTKIQANVFLREYRSVIDLDGRAGNGMRLVYQENRAGENGIHPGCRRPSGSGCDLETARQTILEQELTFRNQLQDLHRLYGRQKELMDEIKTRETNKTAANEEKPSFLASGDSKKAWNSPHSALKFPTFLEGKVVQNFTPSQDARILNSCKPRLSKSSVCLKGPYGLRIQADVPNGVDKRMQDRLLKFSGVDRDATNLSLGAVQALQCNADALTLDLCMKRRLGDTMIADQKNGICNGLVLSRGLSTNSTLNLKTSDFFPNTRDRRNGVNSLEGFKNDQSRKEHPCHGCAEKLKKFDRCNSVGGSCSDKLLAFPQPPMGEQNKGLTQRPPKLFGVELEGCNDDSPLDASSTGELKVGSSSWIDKSLEHNLSLGRMDSNARADMKGKSSCPSETTGNWLQLQGCSKSSMPTDVLLTDSEHSQKFPNGVENRQGELPWFLRNIQDRGKGNLDSLQSCSQNFFRKTETADGEAVQQKKESLGEEGGDNKILGFTISDMNHTSENLNSRCNLANVNCSSGDVDCARKVYSKNRDSHEGLDDDKSELRHGIDLNLSLDEDAPASAPCRATTTSRTETDLEAPAVTESESICEDYDNKLAAEALLSIASHRVNSVVGSACKHANTSCLNWFAEIVSCSNEDNSILDVIDQFEYMTLQLEESKEEQYHGHEPYVSKNNQSEDEAKRPQRGASRRGRLRKDFQRDILPSMATLSRLEVTEDFQAFEKLMKPEGGVRHPSSSRNARGRKRSLDTQQQQRQPVFQLQDRSLTGWGKRTRRLPRQRCSNACLSFTVKC